MPAVRFGNISCSKLNLSAVVLDVLDVQGKSVSYSFGCVGCSGGNLLSCCFGCVECSGENLSAVVLDVLNVQGKICQLLFWMCWMFRRNLSAIVLDVLNVQGEICQLLFWMC